MLHHVFDGFDCMDHRAMIATAEGVPDLLEGMLREHAAYVHGDLARDGDVCRPALACHVAVPDLEMIGHPLLDHLDRKEVLGLLHQHVLKKHLGGCQIDLLVGQGRIARDLDQCALEAAHILGNILCDKLKDGRRNVEIQRGGLGAKDRNARLVVGRLDVSGYVPRPPISRA